MTSPIEASRPPHKLTILAGLAGVLLTIELVRLAVFMSTGGIPAAWSAAPWNAFITRHSCVTAYYLAATEIDREPDVYRPAAYSVPGVTERGGPAPRRIGPFQVDPYEYPPTFLAVPRLLALVARDFGTFRLVWLALNLAVVAAALVLVSRRIDRATGIRSLWLLPLALIPLGVFTSLQGGNAQIAFIALPMLGMLAIERRQVAAGGLLLAYATVSKLFPGVLVVYLLARRDWRAAAWTGAWSLAITAIMVADLGWAPFAAFLQHVPKLLSGEAFPMLQIDGAAAISLSVPGIVLKLRTFGVPYMDFDALRVAGWLYSVVLLVVTLRVARRPLATAWEPLAWLALLGLATLRSPFLPGYGVFQAAWIAAIILAALWPDVRTRLLVLGLWAILVPTTAGPTPVPPPLVATATFLQTLSVLAFVALALRVGRAGPVPASATEVPSPYAPADSRGPVPSA